MRVDELQLRQKATDVFNRLRGLRFGGFEELVGLPLAGLTSYQALFTGAGGDFTGAPLGTLAPGVGSDFVPGTGGEGNPGRGKLKVPHENVDLHHTIFSRRAAEGSGGEGL